MKDEKHIIAFVCSSCGDFGTQKTNVSVKKKATRHILGNKYDVCPHCGSIDLVDCWIVLSELGRLHAALLKKAEEAALHTLSTGGNKP